MMISGKISSSTPTMLPENKQIQLKFELDKVRTYIHSIIIRIRIGCYCDCISMYVTDVSLQYKLL